MSTLKFIPVAALLAVISACAGIPRELPAQPLRDRVSTDLSPATAEDLEPDFRYRLSYGDEVDVRFLRQPDYNTAAAVGFDGTIKLPFLPSVRVEGMTIDAVSEEIERRYSVLLESAPGPADKIYLLGPRDVLEIKFPYINEYSSTVAVRPDGRISLPLIGAVIAEGKSPGGLQEELVQAYSKHLDTPVVILNVVQAASTTVISEGKRVRVALPEMDNLHVTLRSSLEPRVYVGGEVNAPQAMELHPMMTSLQAIMAAGGTNTRSQLASVVILRKGVDGEPKYIVRNLEADIKGEEAPGTGLAATNDILLRPFDLVIVPKTSIAAVSDTLNAYVYDVLPMLRNISLGFNYPLGTMRIEQDTRVTTERPETAVEDTQ